MYRSTWFCGVGGLGVMFVLRLKRKSLRTQRNTMSDTKPQRTTAPPDSNPPAHARWPTDSPTGTTGPLAGVRVLDMTAVGMGPYCTQTLGDYGATVIKVESPRVTCFDTLHRALTRAWVPLLQLNRNKQSLVLNLKEAHDLSCLRELARDADVLVYNVRPQSMRKLGLGFEDLRLINARLIYCGVYGFSEAGPYAGRPAFDDIIQAMSGLADLQGRARLEPPAYVTSIMADKITGLSALSAILAALLSVKSQAWAKPLRCPCLKPWWPLTSWNTWAARHLTSPARIWRTQEPYPPSQALPHSRRFHWAVALHHDTVAAIL